MARRNRFAESRASQRSHRQLRHARPLRLEPLEDRCLMAALIGVDFGTGSVPANWTQITSVGYIPAPTTRSNLTDETGAATTADFAISTNYSGGASSVNIGPINAATLPQHAQSLAGVDNIVAVAGTTGYSFYASFSDLNPALRYEVYVFAVENGGHVDNHTVRISGGGSPIVFTQNPISQGNLWVNNQVGSDSQPLANYAKIVTPTVAGVINVQVTGLSSFSRVSLAGLAIRDLSFVVNSNGDTDDMDSSNDVTTLREAIRLANATPGADWIKFADAMSGQTIDLGGAEFEITEALTIDAAPLTQNVTIDAHQQSRIFNITSASGNVTLTGLTLTGGKTTGDDDPDSGQLNHRGGAIRSGSSGLLTLRETIVRGNATAGSQAVGGGIYAIGSVALIQSTVSGNSTAGSAASGGGIVAAGDLSLTQSTVSGNKIAGNDAHGAGIFAAGALTLTQCTVTNNLATGSDSLGGGVFQPDTGDNDPLAIRGSIIAGNAAAGGSPDLAVDAQSVAFANSVTYSLIGDTSGSGVILATGTGNLLNVDPLLGPLADNGGSTPTHALLPGSPAVDAGSPTPVAFYRFEETSGAVAADLIGAHPGTFKNFVASSQSGSPQVGGNAALFGGVDDYVSVATPFSASQLSGASYSVELWFNANGNPNVPGSYATLVALTTAAGHAVLVERGEDGALRFLNRIPAGAQGGNDLSSVSGVSNSGQWNHLAAVRDGASMQIYLNGAQVASLSNATGNLPADLRLTIGRLSDTQSGRYFAGKLDDVAIYNRALTAGEVAIHASRGIADQRGLLGVVDGNGAAGVQTDIGAYEAQVKPSADFDASAAVDGFDFLAWQRGLGTPSATRAQGNSDGDADTDHSDLAAWRVQFGATGVTAEAASEPAAAPATAAAIHANTLDALYAAGDLSSLFSERTAFRPLSKVRIRRA